MHKLPYKSITYAWLFYYTFCNITIHHSSNFQTCCLYICYFILFFVMHKYLVTTQVFIRKFIRNIFQCIIFVDNCQEGWTYFQPSAIFDPVTFVSVKYSGKCYKFFTDWKTWYEARAYCLSVAKNGVEKKDFMLKVPLTIFTGDTCINTWERYQ